MSHRDHLNKDKKLAKLIAPQAEMVLLKQKHLHLALCGSIISQQLSIKVAAVIYQRLLDLFKKKNPSPQDIVAIPFDQLRAIGLSNAKTNYVLNVCNFFINHKLTDARLHKMTDDELVDFLTQIKGIGRWTVEMILMSRLGREDVFAVDDLGIQQAMTHIYKLDPADKKTMKEKMISIAEKWRPYRTYACKYLWRWKDGNQ